VVRWRDIFSDALRSAAVWPRHDAGAALCRRVPTAAVLTAQRQEAILRDETILRGARSVDFPVKPAVSNEARTTGG